MEKFATTCLTTRVSETQGVGGFGCNRTQSWIQH